LRIVLACLPLPWSCRDQHGDGIKRETLDAPFVSPEGDANRDGRVDLTDFGILKANYQTEVGAWTVADFNGDGQVGSSDFAILKQHFGRTVSAAVPEPAAGLLMAIGICCLAWPFS